MWFAFQTIFYGNNFGGNTSFTFGTLACFFFEYWLSLTPFVPSFKCDSFGSQYLRYSNSPSLVPLGILGHLYFNCHGQVTTFFLGGDYHIGVECNCRWCSIFQKKKQWMCWLYIVHVYIMDLCISMVFLLVAAHKPHKYLATALNTPCDLGYEESK